MAIEKMNIVNIIGHIGNLDRAAKDIVLSDSVHLVNAISYLNSSDIFIEKNQENIEAIFESQYIKPYMLISDYSDAKTKMDKILELCTVKGMPPIKENELIFSYLELRDRIEQLYQKYNIHYENLNDYKDEWEKNEDSLKHLEFIKDMNISLKETAELNYFKMEVFKTTRVNMLKIKDNYENISSIIIKIFKNEEYEVFLSFTPYLLEEEADKVFRSLNCERIIIPEGYEGTAKEMISKISERNRQLVSLIKETNKEIDKLSKENSKLIDILSKSLELEMKSGEVRENTALTNEFFYICGYVPEGLMTEFKNRLLSDDSSLIIADEKIKSRDEVLNPPTRLANNSFFKPFESMVRMYGIPSYNELDPTIFLAITYMIMFGAMFGDVGQGFVILLAGLILEFKLKRKNLGGVFARLGISSMIFGTLYGEIFGFEAIPAILVRPMENITQVLVTAIIFGSILIILGFILGLVNNYRNKNLEEGVFGKEGLTGLVLYITMLAFGLSTVLKKNVIPSYLWIILFVVLLGLILLKEPISNLIRGIRPLYSVSKGDYFIEGSFSLLEAVLSLFSNTLSFIRVGAFALNHVGLFIAFDALAHMMSNKFGSFIMYLLGNLLILGLEGMIVFIQGLRLEYYELFSRYYSGEGLTFNPVTINRDYFIENKILNRRLKKAISAGKISV
ncbi:MAG: ATPase [Bacillota bacterium]|nr:ATPase [Bacillota bacterium]